jgi:hypothetical protein
MKKLSLAVLISLAGVLGAGSSALAVQLPYCTEASSAGAQWWDWTDGSVDAECANANQKLSAAGYTVDLPGGDSGVIGSSGVYDSDQENTIVVVCNQGTLNSEGFGAQVFANAQAAYHGNGWSGCLGYVNAQ